MPIQANIDEMDMDEALSAFIDQEGLYRIEGRQGVENLCTIARALGYKDPQYFGQLSAKACLGDLICFLEDNPGAIEAMLVWIARMQHPEFLEALKGQLEVDDEDPILAELDQVNAESNERNSIRGDL